ncbi:glycoside hydrolase family 3 C-terminal domain-containing protein [Actinomadura kijaniata]|uniref:glycoside hydrolase family 3 C-terminal domain-containing protein n=1 Tax=Actinomadura kijaniata TaxID=46161 RepID=UPI003F1E407D
MAPPQARPPPSPSPPDTAWTARPTTTWNAGPPTRRRTPTSRWCSPACRPPGRSGAPAAPDRRTLPLGRGRAGRWRRGVGGWGRDAAPAILECRLPGQAGGSAVAALLLGACSPSGRLTETIPLRLADVPSHLHFPGVGGHVVHGGGRYVGYRHHDIFGTEVAYPFGHRLSCTRFECSDLKARETRDNTWNVALNVTNPGTNRAASPRSRWGPGGAPVPCRLTGRHLAQWSVERGDWRIDPGRFTVEVEASFRDIRPRAELSMPGDGWVPELGGTSTLGGPVLRERLGGAFGGRNGGPSPALLTLGGDLRQGQPHRHVP